MHSGDVLGDEGRKALNACVKVKIYGKPETRRYDRSVALKRLTGCYGGWSPSDIWWDFHKLVLPRDKHDNFKSYDIVDIHDALVNFDERKCVEKYPKEGPECVKQRDLIDKRRAEVEKELEEANADPEGRLRYSWLVAQRRVRDCFAGNFAEDRSFFSLRPRDLYYTGHVYNCFSSWDQARERTEAKRAALLEEYAEATTAEGNVKLTLPKCSNQEASDCIMGDGLPLNLSYANEILPGIHAEWNNVFDMYKALVKLDGKLLEKYPEEGHGSEELKKQIDKHRADLEEEETTSREEYRREGGNQSQTKYTRSEAERRVRDCFAGTFPRLVPHMIGH